MVKLVTFLTVVILKTTAHLTIQAVCLESCFYYVLLIVMDGLFSQALSWFCSADVLAVTPHIPFILSFIQIVGEDADHSEGTVAACSGLIGYVRTSTLIRCFVFLAPMLV